MEHKNYDELYGSLSDEKKAMIDSCKSPQELAKVLGKLGIALPDALLETVSGGRRVVNQEDYDTWLRYCKAEPDEHENWYTYYLDFNIPRICDLPDGQRSYAVWKYCEKHGCTMGEFSSFW